VHTLGRVARTHLVPDRSDASNGRDPVEHFLALAGGDHAAQRHHAVPGLDLDRARM
jgi:hypothetical protein